MCRDWVVVGVRNNGRDKKTWQECVCEDMKQMVLRRCDAQDILCALPISDTVYLTCMIVLGCVHSIRLDVSVSETAGSRG
jgi:hypothetical protein